MSVYSENKIIMLSASNGSEKNYWRVKRNKGNVAKY